MSEQNEQLAALKAAAEAATPGPWRWELNESSKSIALAGGKPTFDKTVMDFARWGMGGAAPRFNDAVASGELNIMERAEKYGAEVPGREHHANWFKIIAHPDAAWIAAAHPSAILALIAEVEATRRAQPAPTVQADSVAVPVGWKLVPIASTSEMDNAGWMSMVYPAAQHIDAERCWDAMVAAAPAHASSDGRDALRAAAEEFVRRCEAGEIRSKRSYEAFKAALAGTGVKKGGS